MKFRIITIILLLLSSLIIAQDSTKSQAFKNNKANNIYPLIKPKAPTYPLMAGYILQKYASEEDPLAQHELGLRHLLGNGFAKDTVKAVYWIKKAVDKNLTAAKYNYAIMLDNGIGVPWNPFEAFINVKYAAENGMPEAQFFYGVFFTDNLVINRNYNEAFKWFSKAAELNYKPAIDAKKRMEESGLIVLSNDETSTGIAVAKIDSSVVGSSAIFNPDFELNFFDFENTDNPKEENLKKIYEKNFDELKTSLGLNSSVPASALKDSSGQALVEFAAEMGSPEGLLILAKDYEKGITKKANSTLAMENYIKAYRLGAMKAVEYIFKIIRTNNFFVKLKKETDKNNTDAMFAWAALTALGFDYQLTAEQALSLLTKAAQKNHINSLLELGLCYYNGTLVNKNKDKAYEFWNKAAALGSSEAKVRLALSNLMEKNENSDYNSDIHNLKEALEQGSVLAQTALGYCYENGFGVNKEKAQAAKLYRSAANRGSEAAYNSLKRIYNQLRPNDEEFIIYDMK
ncbi:MAG: sel1 repeat family protein [Bacteroidetes bacterium]|nr:sel1 repeat family protein [Bacteroidota bacterium]